MLIFFVLIFAIDFLTKYWVAHTISIIQPYLGYPFGGIGVINTALFKFSIVHTTNTGTAWGVLASHQGALLVFRVLITLGIIGYLFFANPPKKILLPLTCIVAGATGNIIDYFTYGHVIDMFYFIFYRYSYPIFNIADTAIFCSIVYLLINSKKIHFRAKDAA